MKTWTVKDVIEILQKYDEEEMVAWSLFTQDDARQRFPHLNEDQIGAVMEMAIQLTDENEPVAGILQDAHCEITGRPPESRPPPPEV